jgi:hypothetical protein
MDSGTQLYEHIPLTDPVQELRLLQIHGVEPETGVVQCLIETFTINNAPSYLALSYTWGQAEGYPNSWDPFHEETQPTQPSNHLVRLPSGYLTVTNNLLDGLHEINSRARRKEMDFSTDTYLWIDAICINQLDRHERSLHVGVMDQIFSRASGVIVWLGLDLDNSIPEIIPMLKQLSNLRSRVGEISATENIYVQQVISQQYEELLREFELPSPEDSQWHKVVRFYQRRWFSRLVLPDARVLLHNRLFSSRSVARAIFNYMCFVLTCSFKTMDYSRDCPCL